MTSLLIIDDEPKIGDVLARMLEKDGYKVESLSDPAAAIEKLSHQPFDIILCDLKMPGMTGIDVLERAKRINPATDFVMMTAYATPQTAVEAMKKGAIDYLIKPFAIEELKALIQRIEATRNGRDDTQRLATGALLSSAPAGKYSFDNIIGKSQAMQELMTRARKVAASNASVLLRGESGTGKEVLARAIHGMSARAEKPLVMVNCGAIPENLMESELFGHVKGSFTGAIENRKGMFETADGGSIFLDEIGELPLLLQVKLLRVLQEGDVQRVGESTTRKVDVRVIAATNRNLEEAVGRNEFRQDLYYRLNVIPMPLPPLRERRDDIMPLVAHFLARYSQPGKPKRLSPQAEKLILNYDYPGNIRELENAIEHSVVLSDSDVIEVADLPLQIQEFENSPAAGAAGAQGAGALHLDEIERRCILGALEKTRYNYTRAAAHLGITRRTLGYRIQKHGLEAIIEDNLRKLKEAK